MVKLLTASTLLLLLISLASCDRSSSTSQTDGTSAKTSKSTMVSRPKKDFAAFMQGGKLFRENCARCHGDLAQGDPNWRQPDARGKYPPPPLNGKGHAWHHPTEGLKQTIRLGTMSRGGGMPPWADKLTDKEIDSILGWIQSRWSDEVYREWQTRNPQAK